MRCSRSADMASACSCVRWPSVTSSARWDFASVTIASITVCGSTPCAFATSAIDWPDSRAARSSSTVTPIVLAAVSRPAPCIIPGPRPPGPPRKPCGPPGSGAGDDEPLSGAELLLDEESELDDWAVAGPALNRADPMAPPARSEPASMAATTLLRMGGSVDHRPGRQLGIGWQWPQNSSQEIHRRCTATSEADARTCCPEEPTD